MKEPTMEEVLELVEFGRVASNVHSSDGDLFVLNVKSDVYGDVKGTVTGKINGREWQIIETPKEKIIRLIREGKGEEAIEVLNEGAPMNGPCPHASCNNEAKEPHTCPYSAELGKTAEEREETCTCCDYCTHQCAMDI